MEAMDFFRLSEGHWRSQRTTHHLPFRRAELGMLQIEAQALEADDPKVVEICQLHEIDPSLAIGGASVQWQGSMAWDQDDNGHSGSTILALVPDEQQPHQGSLLRERGYAEIVPVVGRYEVDEQDGLVLITEYETMSSIERFWFPNANLRLRTSTVKRFGGFSTASFCAETRLDLPASRDESAPATDLQSQFYSVMGW
ncbi:phycobiliprotein lyase [Halomicronema hongdechloris C2206]|uniref:Chromophore lyase CpcS/CpeS n=1 Tax=Halomicronema hongdechloris C2206 TaxID=1641165 RepID=A0A1Z3HN77_9CYAN|nr:phycobiliprotein lyase [Halomicronema hongdechloris]ASC71725.1 phycobiliprotein lyase [Halomicronema hongdechloris C2206]